MDINPTKIKRQIISANGTNGKQKSYSSLETGIL